MPPGLPTFDRKAKLSPCLQKHQGVYERKDKLEWKAKAGQESLVPLLGAKMKTRSLLTGRETIFVKAQIFWELGMVARSQARVERSI